ncbi:MAG: type II toxin-antitoxin system RelE/ParE family toxin [Candidatus Edwardsbacteria bacterium]|nr:type II toxin-antitoxin system RelE/ParE family toxin [Candidatus Edwardsbacteria bacterium]
MAALPEFRIFETAEFLARLKRIEPGRREFLERKIREYVYPRLRQEPGYGPQIRKLRGYSPDTWRTGSAITACFMLSTRRERSSIC